MWMILVIPFPSELRKRVTFFHPFYSFFCIFLLFFFVTKVGIPVVYCDVLEIRSLLNESVES